MLERNSAIKQWCTGGNGVSVGSAVPSAPALFFLDRVPVAQSGFRLLIVLPAPLKC